MTREEAIENLSLLRIFDAPDLNEAVKMAVSALRAQQSPAKLDRNRWKECPMCTKHYTRFCPKCGRPRTEGTWEELERRINGETTDDEK